MITLGNWGGLPQYLSAREAAARLGVSRRTLYVYVSRHLVRSVVLLFRVVKLSAIEIEHKKPNGR